MIIVFTNKNDVYTLKVSTFKNSAIFLSGIHAGNRREEFWVWRKSACNLY
ncbi:hypothetical protein ACFCT7_10715 [Fulvivirgaceae bacterium LMO-SS25]